MYPIDQSFEVKSSNFGRIEWFEKRNKEFILSLTLLFICEIMIIYFEVEVSPMSQILIFFRSLLLFLIFG